MSKEPAPAFIFTRYAVELTFLEPVLGTVPLNKEIYTDYLLTKKHDEMAARNAIGIAPVTVAEMEATDQEELSTIDEQKNMTGFHRVDNQPIIFDYVCKGFAKDACGMLGRISGTHSSKIRAFRKIIDGLVFVFPRRIPLILSGPITILERPLRASTPQGERVALAASEIAPEGSTLSFTLHILDDKIVHQELLEEWFQYLQYRGLGQWRNAGWGRAIAHIERSKK